MECPFCGWKNETKKEYEMLMVRLSVLLNLLFIILGA